MSEQSQTLAGAITRIWSQVEANSSNVGDLFERITESFYSKIVGSGDTVVDGGAHTGRHTIPLARLVGASGRVIAFEPLQVAGDKLDRLLNASGLVDRVRLRREALSDRVGNRTFYVVHNMPEFSGLKSREYVGFNPEQSEVQVDVRTIDAVIEGAPVSLIKLDLEGGEFRALQGAEQTLRSHGPCCVFENGLESTADGYGRDDFFGFFGRLDYQLYDIFGSPVDASRWLTPGPWQFVAFPRSRGTDWLPLLWSSALEELLMTHWSPAGRTAPPPPGFRADGIPSVTGVVGHVDGVEASIRIRGWAGDLRSGTATKSVVVTIDGQPVATAVPIAPRYDVVGAAERIELAKSGFDIVVPASAPALVEVYGEGVDGTFTKLS